MENVTETQLKQALSDVFIRKLGVDKEEIVLSADLRNDLGADSLDLVEIGIEVKNDYGISISDIELEKIRTVGDLYEACIKKFGIEKNLLYS